MTILASILLAATAATQPKTEVYRLERNAETGDLAVLGIDGVRRPVQLVSPEDYADVTGRIAKIWFELNRLPDSRARLHGGQPKREVRGKEMVTTYPDGYVMVEPARKRERIVRPGVRDVPVPHSAVPAPRRDVSDRQLDFLKQLEARRRQKVKQVTVEHDAITGKDTVK